ncbi:MAG: Sensor protein resE [Parcubacteria group bacterium GW2011_GWA2_47_16]|nr:MAG: Sensor protein resE [Parcubacteria group bacterium GW2011_GWA2_47_16]
MRDILRAVFEFRRMPVGVDADNLLVGSGVGQDVLRAIVIGIVNETVKVFGTVVTESMLMNAISETDVGPSGEAVAAEVMAIVPAGFLESRKVKFLSKEELEKQVAEKTSELRKVNDVLEDKVAKRTEELRELLAEQERSGKLLVRRDLELTHANDKLRELDERKSEFLSVVAHQLRTPLSGIKWTLSMIMNGELGPISNDQKVFIMKSYESNDRMIELVESMLHADRIDSGKFDFKPTPTQIFDLIDNVLYEVLPSAHKRGVQIKFNGRDLSIPQLNVDQEKMRAVFQNLLDNAIKYSRAGGTVSIDITRDAEKVKVAISDQGIGVPEDQKALIFSRFFRARNALKVETDGNGLGLFIVKSIIEKHGGKIWFESKENAGTTFYFTIKI